MALDFVSQVTGRYAKLVNEGVERWKLAAAAARKGSYTADKAVSDSMATWVDTADAWVFPFQLLLPSSVPVVPFKVSIATAKEATESSAIPSSTPGSLQSKDLSTASGRTIPAANVSAGVTSSGNYVIVHLSDLDKVGLVEGIYTGDVGTKAGEKIASVVVEVTK